MSRMAVFVPSRGRPQNIADLVQSWRETAAGAADLVVRVDDDDPQLPAYRALEIWHEPWAWLLTGPRLRLGPTLNELAAEYGEYTAIGFMGDDHRPRTPKWDGQILDVLQQLGSGIVYGDDLLQHERLPTAVFMTSNIAGALGYMCPPGLLHLFLDDAWKALGEGMARLRYLPGVVIEHLHPVAGKAAEDDGYREVNSDERYTADGAAFEIWKRDVLPAAINRLHKAGLC